MRTLRPGLVLLIAALAPGAVAQQALAQCSSTPLQRGVAVATQTAPQQYFSFEPDYPDWGAVGIRPMGTSDWDIDVFDSSAAFPQCVSGPRTGSYELTGVDFVVFTYGGNLTGTEYVHTTQFSGTQGAVVEWESGSIQLYQNGPIVTQSTGPSDVLDVWDVYLEGGASYTIRFTRSGLADTRLFVYGNFTPGPFLSGRVSNWLLSTAGTTGFIPPSTGVYGIVVVNDNGATGSYSLSIERCAPPSSLSSGLVDVHDVSGRRVASLPRRVLGPGAAESMWGADDDRGRRVAPGVYWVRMAVDGRQVGVRKVVLLR